MKPVLQYMRERSLRNLHVSRFANIGKAMPTSSRTWKQILKELGLEGLCEPERRNALWLQRSD